MRATKAVMISLTLAYMDQPLRLMSIVIGLSSLVVWWLSYERVVVKKHPYGLTRALFPLGIFVWGDGLVIAPFWLSIALLTFFLPDFWFMCSAVSLFWLVRSVGETIYWLLQQFVQPNANKPHTLWGNRWYQGDAIWIGYQVAWQCISVIAGLACIYSLYRWLLT